MRSRTTWIALLLAIPLAVVAWKVIGGHEPGSEAQAGSEVVPSDTPTGNSAEPSEAEPDPSNASETDAAPALMLQEDTAQREPAVQTSGIRLRDRAGQPVGGVDLRVWDISVDTGDVLGYLGTVEACDRLYLDSARTDRIRAAATSWTSDPAGALPLGLADLPPDTRLLAAVIEPGWKPWVRVYADRQSLVAEQDLVLAALEGCTVQVDGADPAGGDVHVRVQAMLPRGAVPESLPVEVRSRRAVFEDATTDSNGAVRLPLIDGRVAVWAWQGELRSEVFVGELGESLRLALSPTFTVEGTVTRESGEPVGPYAHVVASKWNGRDRRWDPEATAMVGEGGKYGPLALPMGEVERYRLSVRWTEAGEDDREIASPEPGAQLVEDFLLGPNRDVWVHVWGAKPEEDDVVELPGARVQARWTRPGGEEFTRNKTTISSGWVRLGGIEPGDAVVLSASADGYATSTPRTYPMTEAGIDPFNLVLQPAPGLVVAVTRDGLPVSECFLVHTESDAFESSTSAWREAFDPAGLYTLQPCEGPSWVRAVLPGIGASRPQRVPGASEIASLGTQEQETVNLEIVEGGSARGQVVDAQSGEPVVGALMAVIEPTRGGRQAGAAACQAYSGDAGHFTLEGLPPASGDQVLLVRAPGYRALRLPFPTLEPGSNLLDLGRVELSSELSLTLRIAERSGAVSVMSTWGTGLRGNERRVARPGESLTWIVEDDSVFLQLFFDQVGAYGTVWDWIPLSAQDASEGEWVVDYEPPAAGPLETVIRTPAPWGEVASHWPLRLFFYPDAADARWFREVQFPEPTSTVVQPGLEPGGYQVRAMNSAGEELGRIEWQLEAGVQNASLSFEEPRRRIQLIAHDGQDLQGARVHLSSAQGVGLTTAAVVGEGGWLETTVNFEPDRASGTLLNGACFADVAIDWSGAEGAEPVGFIEVGPFQETAYLCEGAVGPLEGVAWSIHPATWGTSLASGQTDAEGRLPSLPLMEGGYRLEFTLPGYWPRAVSVEPDYGDLTLWLARRSNLNLELLAPDGTPFANEAVSLHHAELNAGSEYWVASGHLESASLTTDAEGVLSIGDLPEGTYRIVAEEHGLSGEAVIGAPSNSRTSVQLAPE